MPQDTTVQYYNQGEYITISGPKEHIDSLYQEYLRNRQAVITSIETTVPEMKTEIVNDEEIPVFVPFLIIGIMVIVIYKLQTKVQPRIEKFVSKYFNGAPQQTGTAFHSTERLTYRGNELEFSEAEMDAVLSRNFPYYGKLDFENKKRFLHRLGKFISRKIFVIHDESGFKEMPILISASAIQISFGLDKYLLPHFSQIHIFPEEFIGYHPTLRILEGNVSGNSVNLSWKHFLNGYQLPDNGQNVGLHEFAHAFYFQYFETGDHVEKDFVETFPLFNAFGNKAFVMEGQSRERLYSDYALRNFHEFWAESIELFFERPADMRQQYEDLYVSICDILDQDPLTGNFNHSA